jgi:hypothetical protein
MVLPLIYGLQVLATLLKRTEVGGAVQRTVFH